MTQTAVPPGWYQDPYGAPVVRWWDGYRWTEHTQASPPPAPQAPVYAQPAVPAPAYPQPPAQQQYPPQAPAQQQYPQAPAQQEQYPQAAPAQQQQYPQAPAQQQYPQAAPAQQQQYAQSQYPQPQPAYQQAGGGPEALLSAEIFRVDQDFKWVDISTSYAVCDQQGNQIGSVAETGQNAARKALRFMSSMDRYLSRKFEIRDAAGVPFLVLSRGTKVLKARVAVARPDGSPMGEIVQQEVIGRISFDLVANGHTVGHIRAENWIHFSFTITDHTGTPVARIARTLLDVILEGIGGQDYYYIQVLRPMDEPLRSLALAGALTVDTMLKPDKDGNA
ncbi:phospholipid scramblase-related protein [Streptomyces sp. YGL11-2]|uniref:phospholipid scramblase-related protein n=1 Tax=Streptomyces sp. YGL11-2 TaxID=3414028 RepID=UPI003CF5B3C2